MATLDSSPGPYTGREAGLKKSHAQTGSSLSALEQAHRWMVLLSTAGLIVLGTSPVVGHHVSARADSLLAGYDHLAGVCLIALHMRLAPFI